MTTTVSITEEVREKLVKIAADLQMKKGKRVDLNEAIDYLISRSEIRLDLLERAWRPIEGSNFESAYNELMKERRKDEERTKRRYGI